MIMSLKRLTKRADRSGLFVYRGHCTEFTKMTGKDSGFIDILTKENAIFVDHAGEKRYTKSSSLYVMQ